MCKKFDTKTRSHALCGNAYIGLAYMSTFFGENGMSYAFPRVTWERGKWWAITHPTWEEIDE